MKTKRSFEEIFNSCRKCLTMVDFKGHLNGPLHSLTKRAMLNDYEAIKSLVTDGFVFVKAEDDVGIYVKELKEESFKEAERLLEEYNSFAKIKLQELDELKDYLNKTKDELSFMEYKRKALKKKIMEETPYKSDWEEISNLINNKIEKLIQLKKLIKNI